MPQGAPPGPEKTRKELVRRHNAALDGDDQHKIEVTRRALKRHDNIRAGRDATRGTPLKQEPTLQSRVRERRRTERELGIRRGKP